MRNIRSQSAFSLLTLPALSVFWILTVACVSTEAFCRLHHWGYPYVWPLPPPYPPFVDFITVIPRFRNFGSSYFFTAPGTPFTYPSPLALVFACFAATPRPLLSFLGVALLSFCVAGVLFARTLRKAGLRGPTYILLLATYTCSFPMWFELQQANCEVVVFVLVALGLWAYLRGRSAIAAILIGFAGAMKFVPFVYVGLFVSKKQYRAAAVCVVAAIAATILAFWLEARSLRVAWHGTLAGLSYFNQHWAMGAEGTGFDHSLFALLKRATQLGSRGSKLDVAFTLRWYTITSIAVAIGLYVRFLRHMPILNQIVALAILALIVPPVSFDYTLIHLYVPCALILLWI